MTLPKKLRLTREAFPKVLQAKKRLISEHFSLSYSQGTGFSAVVSKKVAKRSVDRHLMKRRMLEVLKRGPHTKAIIAYARSGAPSLPFSELKKELETLLARV